MGAHAYRWRARFADLLWPGWCLACDASLRGESALLLLCRACRGRLRPVDRRNHCRRCLEPLRPSATHAPLCLGCRAAPAALDRLVAGWWYEPPITAVLRALKFGRLEFLAAPLVGEAGGRELLVDLPAVDLVVPIPMAIWRRLGRGFNQAESLARALADRLGTPCRQALRRRSPIARRQARLGRAERLHRLDHDLAVRRRARGAIAGRSILLVDDIVTTGSTLAAAARVLRSAGAGSVSALAIAATPRRGFQSHVSPP